MRLKQLKLAGFKSFANPTTFHFSKTITAIVGPNGCGKSNVIDAIRWVLGESSAKQLRGGAMSDVIFAGTQDKAPKSLASVELVFEHTQATGENRGILHALNLYQELAVRRQINKEGKSDYFINGTKVRRRDVIDVFLGTGLGARSYAVIEQGMIGRIIDANPWQLREFIEEASGVSRYQSRRSDTQKQLDTAHDNLARLQDMVSELTAQQKRLEKQAKTAQQAQTWQQQLDNIQQQLLLDDYAKAQQKQQALRNDYQAISQQVLAKQQHLAEIDNAHQQTQQQISEQQQQLQAQQHLVQRQWQQHFETQSLLKQSEQNLNNDRARHQTLAFEMQRFADYQQDLHTQQQQAQHQIAPLPAQLAQIEQQLNALQNAHQQTQQQRDHIAKQLIALNQQKTETEKQLAVSQSTIRHHEQQQQQEQQREQQHQRDLAAWHTAKAAFEQTFLPSDMADFDKQLASLGDKITHLEASILARQEQLADQADEVESLTRQQRQAEQQHHALQTEQHTLQNLLAQQTAITARPSLLASNSAAQQGLSQLPRLIDQLQLTKQGKKFAPLFDLLSTQFAAWHTAHQTAQQTEQQTEQPPTKQAPSLLPHLMPTAVFLDDPQNTTNAPTSALLTQSLSTWLPLSTLIAAPKLTLFTQVWLNPQPVSLMPATLSAKLADLPKGHWLLLQSMDEQLILVNHQLWVNITTMLQQTINKTTPLRQQFSHERRIEEITEAMLQQQPQLQRLNNALQEATISLQEWQAQDQAARQQLLTLTQQQQQCQTDQRHYTHRYQAAFDQLQQDKQRLDAQASSLTHTRVGVDELLDKEHTHLTALTHALSTLQPTLQQHIKERQALDDKLSQQSLQQQTWQQQQQRIHQTIATAQLQITASSQQLTKAEQDQTRLQSEYTQLQQKIETQAKQLPKLQQQLAHQQAQLDESNHKHQQLSDALSHLESTAQSIWQAQQQAAQQYEQLQQQSHTAYTALALAQQNQQLIGAQFAHYELSVPNDNEPLIALSDTQRKNSEKQRETLKNQLSALGAVNHAAVLELAQVNERLQPLTTQINDLTASSEKLQQAIKHIDQQTKQLFMAMLDQVNVALNNLFTQVFGGGQAQLVLADNESKGWQAGLELMAQPKGKKNSRLALLSGGEKTLTALSLIFAIFQQQPAPFCVLDEVDAPLDDANVARFTRLIQQLAKDVQFIFISHNKLAMQIADELKGVTMPTAGISKLVSVDMTEVEAYLL